MREYTIDYASFKSIMMNSPVYFHYQDLSDSDNAIHIWSQKDHMATYFCCIDADSPEKTDFDTWSWQAGDWDWKLKTWDLDYTGKTKHDWQFVADSGSNAIAMLLKGTLVISGFDEGDQVIFRVIDKDGIYAPAGYVFREFVDVIMVNGHDTLYVDPKQFDVPSRSKVLSGLYLELEIVKVDANSAPRVFATLEYDYKEAPV